MPAVSHEMPLLTLPTVLFPGTFLPLQIADETQRALLRDCVERGDQLGVVLNPGDSELGRRTLPCTTGCLATVTLLIHEIDDDQPINVVLYGEQRMRIVDFIQQDPYLTGHVEVFDDYAGLHAQRRSRQAGELFQRYLTLVRERYQADVIEMEMPKDPTTASYMLASVLQLPQEVKQRWLESASVAYRLEEELAYLNAECEKLTTFLAISQYTKHQYTVPDYRLYVSLISQN